MKMRLTKKATPRLNQIAFTLVEAMIATALLAILGISLYGGMSSGFALTQASRENLRATQILVERMEGIRLYNWNQVVYSNWIPSQFTESYYPLTKAGESAGITYTGTMSLASCPLPGEYAQWLRTLTITLNWTSGGVPRARTLTTFVARDGVQNYVYNSTNYLAP